MGLRETNADACGTLQRYGYVPCSLFFNKSGVSVKLAVNNRVSLQNTIEMLLDALGPSTFKAGSSCLYWNAILQYMVYYWGLLQACLFEVGPTN